MVPGSVPKACGRLSIGQKKSVSGTGALSVTRWCAHGIPAISPCKGGWTARITRAPRLTSIGTYRQNWMVSPNPCSDMTRIDRPVRSWLPSHRNLVAPSKMPAFAGTSHRDSYADHPSAKRSSRR